MKAAADAAGAPAPPAVRCEGLAHVYPDGSRIALGPQPLHVGLGERVALLGPNGSGKSTVLLHVLGLLRPTDGHLSVLGRRPDRATADERAAIGGLLQNADEQLLAPTVRDDVAFTPRNLGLPDAEVERITERALARFGIAHLRDKVPHYLSAGERRRVALAGALVLRPRLIVLDEPFASLDPSARRSLVALLNAACADWGATLLLATHFVQLVPDLADRVYLLRRGGQIVAAGTPAEVLTQTELLAHLDLEPPALAALFSALARRGIQLPPALSTAAAADTLAQALRRAAPTDAPPTTP